jgi:hypothetical protein
MPKAILSDGKRRRIYERDQYQCWYCGKQLVAERPTNGLHLLAPDISLSPTVDHLEARVSGGYDLDSNLVTACRSCNSRKGPKTVEEYRAYLSAQHDTHARALKCIEAGAAEAGPPYADELRRIAAWIRGETAAIIIFWGERKLKDSNHVSDKGLAGEFRESREPQGQGRSLGCAAK